MTLLNASRRAFSTTPNANGRRTEELYAAQTAQHVLDLFKTDAPSWEILAHILTLEPKPCQILTDDAQPFKAELIEAVAQRNDPAITQAVAIKLKLPITAEVIILPFEGAHAQAVPLRVSHLSY
ncbi:MAG: hypothetical protein AB7E85_02040 [Pseudobdellovibrionaceae bacterium]